MRKVEFTVHKPRDHNHRRHFIGEHDSATVLRRLPAELLSRLRKVHFSDRARGRRVLGYVNRGRREICICALPPHMSLTTALIGAQTPEMFGAIRGHQWPFLAIRRFMLYETLLHELGHLQVVHDDESDERRKFAMEPRAEEFANLWREKLWSEHFSDSDLAHNPPSSTELEKTRAYWPQSHAEYKKGLKAFWKRMHLDALTHFHKAVDLYDYHSMSLEMLGVCYLLGAGTEVSIARGKEYFAAALKLDPLLPRASRYMRPSQR